MTSDTVGVDLDDERFYYVCPSCGFKQRSRAERRITCHRCDRSYRKEDAKKERKTPDEEKGTGFFRYESADA
ncbi:MAG: hypothetical protein SVU32_02860 [Candidatus Nanohaloarchaea archaeon]|nr:hypothetical protein [Candidatus Nanohaloarchaea archaeon]